MPIKRTVVFSRILSRILGGWFQTAMIIRIYCFKDFDTSTLPKRALFLCYLFLRQLCTARALIIFCVFLITLLRFAH